MRWSDWARAWVIQKVAPVSVNYGADLRFGGRDLAKPARAVVPTRHGPVRIFVYRPPGTPRRNRPAYVHFHGGAFLMRYPAMDDFWCRYVADQAGVVVVNVDFHCAPQVTFPVAQEECHDVAAWISQNGAELGIDGSRIAIGGFSSGGGLAASVALQARDSGSFQPVLQLLGVPALDLASEPRPGEPGMISVSLRRMVRRVYFPDPLTRTHPYASPLCADDLSGLPWAVVLTAERDVLRAAGDEYAARLRAAGIPVVHDVTPGADHYFLSADLARARTTMSMMAAAIREACVARAT